MTDLSALSKENVDISDFEEEDVSRSSSPRVLLASTSTGVGDVLHLPDDCGFPKWVVVTFCRLFPFFEICGTGGLDRIELRLENNGKFVEL